MQRRWKNSHCELSIDFDNDRLSQFLSRYVGQRRDPLRGVCNRVGNGYILYIVTVEKFPKANERHGYASSHRRPQPLRKSPPAAANRESTPVRVARNSNCTDSGQLTGIAARVMFFGKPNNICYRKLRGPSIAAMRRSVPHAQQSHKETTF